MNKVLLGIILAGATLGASAQRISIPKVYSQENTGNQLTTVSQFPTVEELPVIEKLPDALSWHDGSGRVSKFSQWERRRNEIGSLIQHYGIGTKPVMEDGQVTARMKGDTLLVYVTVGGRTICLSSEINYPKVGKPPYAVMIGTSMIALPKTLFEDKPIATMVFHEKQVNDYGQWGPHHERGEHPFDRLYPELTANGAYSEWAWGMSRLIDALQQLGPEITKIDTKRIGVTGCSYAGKMALYCGAFDERIALTIAQEPGGGGAAAWRVSHTMEEVEDLDKTDYHWFMESQRENFGGDNVYKLPYDQHELCAMVCPRALLLLGNPDYKWLADESMRVSAEAAREVWRTFGIEDRFDCDIIGGHPHCQLPESQFPIVNKFLEYLINIKK
jgi:dienelactone hydrolase